MGQYFQYLGNFKIVEASLHIVGLLVLPGSEEFLVRNTRSVLAGSRHRTRIKSLRRRLGLIVAGVLGGNL